MDRFGLIGKSINYSFSKTYFTEKFASENIRATYENFDLSTISDFLNDVRPLRDLKGLNVTIPYKELIIPFLDGIEREAHSIGAVNTIAIENGKFTGHNTDCFGFMKSLFPLLEKQHTQALILGTGGASKAVAYALKSLGIAYHYVSRNPKKNQYSYEELSQAHLQENFLIINCTPVGTYPNVEHAPAIPYEFLTSRHLLYDLVYNPKVTQFLAHGKMKGCKIYNGKKMLEFQAERAWEIWTSS